MQIAEQNLHGFCRLRPAVWGPGSRPGNTQQRQVASRLENTNSVVGCSLHVCGVVAVVCVMFRVLEPRCSIWVASIYSRSKHPEYSTINLNSEYSTIAGGHWEILVWLYSKFDAKRTKWSNCVWCPMPFICTFIPLQLAILKLKAPLFLQTISIPTGWTELSEHFASSAGSAAIGQYYELTR